MRSYGDESGLQEVTHGSGATFGLCVNILDTSELEQTLDAGRATMPVLWGAGMGQHMAESTFALTFDGTVCVANLLCSTRGGLDSQ